MDPIYSYLPEGYFLSFQLILEMLCSVPQSNLICCILSWEIRGMFCLLGLFRKFLQLDILSMLSCHHDALYRYVSYVSSHQLQLPARFHRSSQDFHRVGAGRPALTPRSRSLSPLEKWSEQMNGFRKCILCIQTEKTSCAFSLQTNSKIQLILDIFFYTP